MRSRMLIALASIAVLVASWGPKSNGAAPTVSVEIVGVTIAASKPGGAWDGLPPTPHAR